MNIPYFLEARTNSDATVKSEASIVAPSENGSDCTALVDLKKRVRELDSLLNDLSAATTTTTHQRKQDPEEESTLYSLEDNFGHGDDEEQGFEEVVTVGENNVNKSNSEECSTTSQQRVELPVDMVHTLSSLFLRQSLPATDTIASLNQITNGLAITEGLQSPEQADVTMEIQPAPSELGTGSQVTSNDQKETDRLVSIGLKILIAFGLLCIIVAVAYVILRQRSIQA